MGARSLAVIAATCAAAVVAPGQAQELRTPSTMIFMEVPLDARTVKEQMPNFGLQFQGSRPYQTLRLDQKMFRSYRPGFAFAGIEATYLVAGALGLVAVASVASKDGATTQQLTQAKAKQQQACPTQTCGQ
jgi:hypothetical protein